MYVYIYIYMYIYIRPPALVQFSNCPKSYPCQTPMPCPVLVNEQLPNHRHRNSKAFEERIQTRVYHCLATE